MRFIHQLDGEDGSLRERYRDDPDSVLRIPREEADRIIDTVEDFYQEHLASSRSRGYVVGLSGGVDSSTVATLLARAVGPEKVHGLVMPAPHSRDEDVEDALGIAENLGVDTNDPHEFRRNISGIVKSLESLGEESEDQRVKRGNILARCRMIVLRDTARARDFLVAGTTNASERDLGYMTLAADGRGGVDNEALYELYKTTERDVSRALGVPDRIIEKSPSADLWKGQKDIDELELPYETLDRVLAGLRMDLSPGEISGYSGVEKSAVKDIMERKERNRFKTEIAPHPYFS